MTTRLALGVEPIDAMRGGRVPHPLQVTFDDVPLGLPRPVVDRHDSCLHALRYPEGAITEARLRLFEENRRYVPRRLNYPLLDRLTADSFPPEHRIRRPAMFPGAAFDAPSRATGLRARVLHAGPQERVSRWVRVEARTAAGELAGRAHGDDRGEFFLLIQSGAAGVGDLPTPFELRVTVFSRPAPPVPAGPDVVRAGVDPLWDLPLEAAPIPGAPDPVSTGESVPAVLSATVTRTVSFVLGHVLSDVAPFVI